MKRLVNDFIILLFIFFGFYILFTVIGYMAGLSKEEIELFLLPFLIPIMIIATYVVGRIHFDLK